MNLSTQEFWLMAHLGMGVVFLHASAGGVGTLLVPAASRVRTWIRSASTSAFAVVAWLTVVSGTWLVYPGYRAEPPPGAEDVSAYPKAALIAEGETELWHTFAMEWKEHVGWLTPFLATAVAYTVLRHGELVRRDDRLRRALAVLFVLAVATAVIAASAGAFINKVAPNDFLDV
jgi:hypothetical protein